MRTKDLSRPIDVIGQAVLIPGIKVQRFGCVHKRPSPLEARKMMHELRRRNTDMNLRLGLFLPKQSTQRRQRVGIDGFKRKFERLVREWKRQSAAISSPAEIAMISEYQQIIGMGQRVVPLLLAELKREPDFWFWALRAITGENPVPDDASGDLDAMTEAWIEWGFRKGFR